MTISLGAHIGQQNMSTDEMRALWRWLDESGMDWISLWDHLYEAPPAGGTLDHFEAVAALGALAVETSRARLGCLVFYVGYRNPGLLAKSAITLDHLSGGRFELGLGGGWHEQEAEAFGYDFPSVGVRLDMLDEATEMIRSLLTPGDGETVRRTTFAGEHYAANDASSLPPPVGPRLPIWIGGKGERRTLRTTARLADGWNAAYISAAEFGRLNGVLNEWCETEGRDPSTIERSINVSFALGSDGAAVDKARRDLDASWGPRAEQIAEGSLLGTPDEAADQLMAYVDAGAELINIALRAPFDRAALETYVNEVVPQVRSTAG